MTYARELLFLVADEIKVNRKDVQGFIQTLQKNWYSQKEALESLSLDDYLKMGIPARLANIMIQKLQKSNSFRQNRTITHKKQKMQIQSEISNELNILKKKLNKQQFNQVVNDLIRIFINIRNNTFDQKYRTLKKSNKKINTLFSLKQVCNIAQYGGFKEFTNAFILQNIKLDKIDECIEIISKQHEGSKFNPYQAHIVSNSKQQFNVNQCDSTTIYNRKLEELENQRAKVMSKPIKDRQIRIFRNQEKPQFKQYFDEDKPTEDQILYKQHLKQMMMKYDQDPQFMNRRRQQYQQLIKKPCFSQTIIRVKCPDNWIFQCKFSPLETFQTLLKIFHQHVEDNNLDYYLFMTPPVQKLKGKILRQTFYDSGCVPRAIFYFGTETQLKSNPLRVKSNKFFGLF